MFRLRVLVVALTSLLGSTPLFGYEEADGTGPQAPSAYREQIDVEWILVPVVARTPAGYARGLEARDFDLVVDGIAVSIESFEARTDAPVSLVHLQDLSGSMALGGKLEMSRRLLSCLLEGSRSGDELAVASFAGGRIQVEVPLTPDVEVVREAMAIWRGYGTTGLHDAVAWLPEIAVHERSIKRAALLVTDGADNASLLSPAQARNMVRQAQLPVYVVGLGSGSAYELDHRGHKRHRFADVLNLLAHMTGGRYHAATGPSDVETLCAGIAEDLRAQYVLGFSTGAAGEARYRTIEVEARGKKTTVTHRQSYFGRSPATRIARHGRRRHDRR